MICCAGEGALDLAQQTLIADPFTPLRRIRRSLGRMWRLRRRGSATSKLKPSTSPFVGFGELELAALSPSVPKRALLCYLSAPFHDNPLHVGRLAYSFDIRAVEMARALNRLGYVVDAVDYLDGSFMPEAPYDLFVGTYRNVPRLASLMPERALKVYFATRAHAQYHEAAQRVRMERLAARCGVLPKLREMQDMLEGTEISHTDAVIALGSDFTASTFRAHHPRVYSIDSVALPLGDPNLEQKDFVQARKNILYIGSWPFIKKGLDLVLESFTAMPELTLWIAAPIQSEPGLMRAYRREFFHTPNIKPLGWCDIHSELFASLAQGCAFSIFPSCAEGSAGAVINAMARGLIPIASRESGVDLTSAGVELRDCEIETIMDVVRNCSSWSESQCLREAQRAYGEATTRYTAERFGQRFEEILRELIDAKASGSLAIGSC